MDHRFCNIYRDFKPKTNDCGVLTLNFQSQIADRILKLEEYDLFQLYSENCLRDEDRINSLLRHNRLEILKRFSVKVPRYECPDSTDLELVEYMFQTQNLFPTHWYLSRRFEIVKFCIDNGAPVDRNTIRYLIRPQNREILPKFLPLDEKEIYRCVKWDDLSFVKFIFEDIVVDPNRETLIDEAIYRSSPDTVDWLVERFKLEIPYSSLIKILNYRWDDTTLFRHLWVKYGLRISDKDIYDLVGRKNGEHIIRVSYGGSQIPEK